MFNLNDFLPDIPFIWEIIFGLFLGFVQGVTEFLPISSTAHLRLISAAFLGGKDIGLKTSNVIQLGTSLAIIQYFWADLKIYFRRLCQILSENQAMQEFLDNFWTWWQIAEEGTQTIADISRENKLEATQLAATSPAIQVPRTDILAEREAKETEENSTNPESERKIEENSDGQTEDKPREQTKEQIDLILAQLAVGTLPILILGAILKNFASSMRDFGEIALFLLAGAGLLAFAEFIHRQAKARVKSEVMTKSEVFLIGLFQSLAIFPGMSRSGSTLAGALLLGRGRAESIRFSFLLSIPALLISGLVDLLQIFWEMWQKGGEIIWLPRNSFASESVLGTVELSVATIILTFAAAYFVGLLCLRWLLNYLSKHSSQPFIIYRVGLAIVLIILSFFVI